ncbi:MAG: translocation/assembly module TamB domain-containing protein [Prevotella sp.]|nr:translocation/assembly module TamB domain-containing protein [Prevotella sp.]
MKKFFKWTGIVLLSPVLLFLILAALLYLPPVQNWVVQRLAAYASEQTGMDISIGHVDMSFPLDLELEDVKVIRPAPSTPDAPHATLPSDTIADIRRAVADVKLWPLLHGNMELDALELNDARINSADFIGDLRIDGTIGCLTLTSPGINLNHMEMELRQPRLSNTRLTVFVSDTAAVDTSTAGWHIRFDRFDLENTRLSLVIDSAANFRERTTDNSMQTIDVFMGRGSLHQADIDLGLGRYGLGTISWQEGRLSYNNMMALSDVDLVLDSLYYDGSDLLVGIGHTSLREDSTGLVLSELHGTLSTDGDHLNLRDLAVAASLAPRPEGLLPWSSGPPLQLQARMDGNEERLQLEHLIVDLPASLNAEATGELRNLLDPERLSADISMSATAHDLSILDLGSDLRIPRGLSMTGDVALSPRELKVLLTANEGNGTARLNAKASSSALLATLLAEGRLETIGYKANASVNHLNLRHFMPHDSLGLVTASLQLSGHGTSLATADIKADADLHSLQYAQWQLDSVQATADISGGHALISATSRNALLTGIANIDAQLPLSSAKGQTLTASIEADLQAVDLLALGVSDAPTTIGLSCNAELQSDLHLSHRLSALVDNIYITDTLKTHHPEKLGLLLKTSADTTMVRMQSGDLIVKVDAQDNYERLFSRLSMLADTLNAQRQSRTIDHMALKRLLPTMHLYATSQQGNPMAGILQAAAGISFKDFRANISTSPVSGLNGDIYLLSLNVADTPIDTIRLSLVDKVNRLTFNGQVTNGRRNKLATFSVLFDGLLQEHGTSFGLRYYDDQGRRSVRLGAKAEMVDGGLRFQLIPTRPTLGYKDFDLNDDNYLLLHDDLRLEANVDLKADDGTRIIVYSENQDSTLLQDLTVSVSHLDLGELTGGVAMLPNVSGTVVGDYHLTMDQQHNISVASDMQVSQMAYEGSPIGNIGAEFVYLLREDETHVVNATLSLDNAPIGQLQGTYHTDKHLDGTLQLTRLPLSIADGFMPDHLLGFEGYADGTLSVSGLLASLKMNGEVKLTDGYLVSTPYGMRMRFGDTPVEIKDSKLLLDQFALYAYNDNPLNISGTLDLNDNSPSAINLRLVARNFQLINAKQKKESVAYGRMFVDFFARLTGSLEQLKMRGRLNVLGTTDLNYILLDSPLSTDNQMDELVRFTDFNDTIPTVVERPESDALDIDLTMSIDQGAHVKCALNAEQTNYVDLLGGGDLRLRMGGEGMTLNGRYTVESGTMKYSLPVIPLKTFTIKEGSYVEFTGEPGNPTLNLTATERTRATVGQGEGQSRSVSFDCGVVITQTLENMGLQFTISAPEDMQVQGELASMSVEQRGKLAVTMLTTGMYLADGNTSAFSMNSALSSFLQSEINNITAGALKTVDLQLGLDNTTDASGQMHTDYSFKFAKRFWNNRLNVQIGGKVSTGQEVQGQQQSFFDNVTMEYRLSPTSNQYVKLFYKQNVYDWLEGYTGEYGGGFIWKRKLDRLTDIFKKTTRVTQYNRPTPDTSQHETHSKDSIQ